MHSTHQSSRALRATLFIAALAAIAWALLFARPPSTPGPQTRDFEAYYAAGHATNHNPYSSDIWQVERTIPGVDPERYEFLPFVGPPHGLLLWELLSKIPYGTASAIWSAALAGAGLAALWACAKLCGARVGIAQLAMLVPLGIAFAPLTSALALGQVALLAFAASVAAMLVTGKSDRKTAWSLALAALQPNVALGFAAYVLRAAGARAAAYAALGVLLLSEFASARHANIWSYLGVVREHGNAEKFDAIQLTPTAILAGFGLPNTAASSLGLLLAIVVITATIYVMLRRRPADLLFGAALICAATPFLVPFFHEHDLVATLLPIFYCLLRLRGNAALIGAAASVFVAVDWLGLAQRPGGFAQSLLLAFAFAVAVAHQSRERRAIVFALAPLALVICLGLIAQAHPAPIWPDALPHTFMPPPNASASQIWEAEQRASGLFEPNATWAFLRTMSLAGCGGLWLALATGGLAKLGRGSTSSP